MKSFKFSFLLCFLISLMQAQDSYTFEVSGEFAEELKELVQKHAKDENISINIYKNQTPSKTPNLKSSIEEGQKIYQSKCLKCHGKNGERRAYAGSRKLLNMSASEIYHSFQSYYSNPNHGGSGKIIMQPISASISNEDLGYIIAYLKGENDFISAKAKNTDISRKPTTQGTYLK
ncbi:c-type cytochrome [Campylobacter sp. FMV-PI01]|uniref:C-type cytochrome n=1 Tax=Campylobacter portucalensis TaxID=2608384 RepID=A0A6L5WIT6_9BACT|nr:c-type cytochrome [Campylobacter portucalensis]MSN96167.1 c-type cytochrome [Campylobacter portucalensis]